ncbi:helix-turn-helix domain-containing protein [Phytohabitans kaempferiae]|uniref:Helix-turn-helix domain-containing protein n=1 Tax=Phytohabitans kaempferiae TaxID=1620943 RepID=A0ABV6LWA8_9ACTN
MAETGGIELGVALRALRRRADLSQRELAERAGLPKSTVTRIEAGLVTDPRFRTVERLVRAAGAALALGGGVESGDGVEAVPSEELRDRAERHYPAHLDVRPVEDLTDWAGAWWAHWHRLPRAAWPLEPPEYTYDLSRTRRGRRRHREWARRGLRVRRADDAGVEVGGIWRWLAQTADGETVGELRATVRAAHPEEPAGLREVLLDGVVVAAGLRGLGIGRRLVGEFAAEVARSGIVARAVVGAGLPAAFLRRCGFEDDSWRAVALVLRRGGAAGRGGARPADAPQG